jgi:hypothetical protein
LEWNLSSVNKKVIILAYSSFYSCLAEFFSFSIISTAASKVISSL